MNDWGWRERRTPGMRDFVQRGLRPLAAAVPWVTVGLLFMTIVMVGGTFTAERGALFALPDTGVDDVADAMAVSLLIPTDKGTLVFFDDTRYLLDDETQMDSFRAALSEKAARIAEGEDAALLAMADWRIMGRDLLKFAAIAKRAGVRRVLFAERQGNGGLE